MNEATNHAVLIDRLAAGELDEAMRRDLFVWLDGEPSRWRRCALALLEARELEEAFGFGAGQAVTAKPTASLTRAPTARPSRPGAIFVLAASLMIAFFLGILARGFWVVPAPMIVEAQKSVAPEMPLNAKDRELSHGLAKQQIKQQLAAQSGNSLTAVAAAPPGATESHLIPPYVRSQLERRGYQLTSHPAQLPVILPDGRRVMVPVDQFQLNYVGQRTY
jgi:anti-sigma factor RsiW